MAQASPIVYTYEGPADHSEFLEGIVARDLTQADVDALPEERRAALLENVAPSQEIPGHVPLFAVPARGKSQGRLRAEAATDQAAFTAAHTGAQAEPGTQER